MIWSSGLTEGIDLAKEVGCQNVITFTGRAYGMDEEKAAQYRIDTWKKVLPHAEKQVTLCSSTSIRG